MSYLIKDLPDAEKPREKFKKIGAKNLTNEDLIAIILRTGTSDMSVKDLAIKISKEINDLSLYSNWSLNKLTKIKGIGEVKAITLLSAIELGRRTFKTKERLKFRITNAKIVYELFKFELDGLEQENLIATGLCRRGEFGLYDFFRDKLMFPIFNPRGQIVAFSGRSLDGSEPKYINTSDTEIFHKRKTVFGLNFARDAIYRANRSIVVEGQIDAIKMQENGFPETVAPLGTALTEDHIAILCKSNRNITFCFDGDNAGQKAAARACGIVMPFLRDNSDVKFAFVTGGKDPDEILKSGGVDAMKKIIDDAVPLVDFLWKLANTNFVVATPGGRVQAEKFLKGELDKITDNDLKNEIFKEYEKRKFESWRRWKRDKQIVNIKLPDIDLVTKNTMIYIVNTFPELAERYIDFLGTLNIDFDGSAPDLNLSCQDAEKYIVFLKLQRYIDKLNIEKKELTTRLLSGDESAREELANIDSKIQDANEKREKLASM